MQQEGKVVDIIQQSGVSNSGKEWHKNQVVIEFGESESINHLAVDFFGDKLIEENPVSIGQDVVIEFTLTSREYQGKWFTNVSGSKITLMEDENPKHTSKTKKSGNKKSKAVEKPTISTDNVADLPF